MVIGVRLDERVVEDAGALPDEAHGGVALVVARQSAMELEHLEPGLDVALEGLDLVRREDRGAASRRRWSSSGLVPGGHVTAPIGGLDPLGVGRDEVHLARLEGLGQLLEVAIRVAQQLAQGELVVAFRQRRVVLTAACSQVAASRVRAARMRPAAAGRPAVWSSGGRPRAGWLMAGKSSGGDTVMA